MLRRGQRRAVSYGLQKNPLLPRRWRRRYRSHHRRRIWGRTGGDADTRGFMMGSPSAALYRLRARDPNATHIYAFMRSSLLGSS